MEERFLADRNLGKLAKWMRILGYDTLYDRGNADGAFLRRAREDGRITLTRPRDINTLAEGRSVVLITSDHVPAQIGEVLSALALSPDPSRRMTRCLDCNASLEEISKEAVSGLVAAYVYEQQVRFMRCPSCGGIFWPGTHHLHIEETLRRRSPAGHP
jgi:uncharacterized protein with PIN domain